MTLSNLSRSGLYNYYTGIRPSDSSGRWATISAMTGSPTRTSYTDAQGVAWYAYKWTASGTITVAVAGVVDALVSGGGGGYTSGWGGQNGWRGGMTMGMLSLPTGTINIYPGGGGATGGDTVSGRGGIGSISGTGVYMHAMGGWGGGESGGWGGGPGAGTTSSITGSSVTYGGAPNSGVGPVVIRVPQSFVTASSGWV